MHGADILVTSGGASVGDYDLVQQALAAEGLALSFWKVALRPGQPLMLGRLGADACARPAGQSGIGLRLRRPVPRAADPAADRPSGSASPGWSRRMLGRDLPANDERADYLRATLAPGADGLPVATPFPLQDSSMLLPLAEADCLLIREPHAPAAKAGSRCVILKLDRLSAAFGGLSTCSRQIKGCGTHMEQIVSVHDLFRLSRDTS